MMRIKFGMEFEFYNSRNGEKYDPTIYYLPHNWLHTREYYRGMQEIMSYPMVFHYGNFIKTIRRAIYTMRNISQSNESTVYLFSKPHIAYNGLISNGLHVHISITTKENKSYIRQKGYIPFEVVNNLMLNLEENDFIGTRTALSHHIWGQRMSSEYNFKTENSKFNPIIISPRRDRKPTTLEIRIFDFETIFQPKKLYKVIESVVRDFVNYTSTEKITYEKETHWLLKQDIGDVEKSFSNGNYDYFSSYYNNLLKDIIIKEFNKTKYFFEDGKLCETKLYNNSLFRFILGG